ncbi:hypothetical protein MMC30_007448 [Trapelia coarctata]|nr:hypothetical protein [Trapelia coarctata]
MFLVQTSDLPRIVLSAKYLEELRGLPESRISHRESVCDRFLGYWTGLDVVRQSQLHNEICQTTLVQNLPTLLPNMYEEATLAISEFFGDVSAGCQTPVSSYGSIFNIIARVNSRVLVGFPLCRDKEWLQVSEGYPQDSVAVVTDLRQWTPALRPFVYPFLASTKRLKREYAIANQKLRPLIEERKDAKLQKYCRKDAIPNYGFHASTATAVHVLYDLCAEPEYFQPLRQEIEDSLTANNGQWSLAVLRCLERLDSFIKESQRMNAPGLLGFNRKVMAPLELSDGTRLPQGLIITVPIHHITHDPANWPQPDKFDGFRFYEKRRSKPEREAEHQFAAVSAKSLGFGYGRFACPGRVFAAAQLKLVLGLLISEYDFAFPETAKGVRPGNIYMDDMVLPDRSVQTLWINNWDKSITEDVEGIEEPAALREVDLGNDFISEASKYFPELKVMCDVRQAMKKSMEIADKVEEDVMEMWQERLDEQAKK